MFLFTERTSDPFPLFPEGNLKPMSNEYSPLKWGILGPGSIANRFGDDVKPLSDHQIYAVGSRDVAKATKYAEKYGAPKAYGSYEELVSDPDVDAVYVATPHPYHKEHTLLALRAGKAVLCEKPFTVNLAEAEEVIAEARALNVFLMEGMWSRCFPLLRKAKELVASGAIGKPRLIEADFGFKGGDTDEDGALKLGNPDGRLFNPALAGGALLDVGVYVVSLAQMFFGTPEKIASLSTFGKTNVDENTGILLGFAGGALGVLHTSLQVNTAQKATVLGSNGRLEVHSPWWCPKSLTVYASGKEPETIKDEFTGGSGFQFEAQHVAECLRAGLKESPLITLDETLAIMKTLDTIRTQIGLTYPME